MAEGERPDRWNRVWTQEELDYLREQWGSMTIPQIAGRLHRNVNAVKVKSVRLGLRGQAWTGEMMTARQVARMMGVDVHAICERWIPRYGLPARRLKRGEGERRTTIIRFGDLLDWLESHQQLWDSLRLEKYALGMEYDWLVEKRQADAIKRVRTAKKWTREEDDLLIHLFRYENMTYEEIAAATGRSKSSVIHRLRRLDVWGTGESIDDRSAAEAARSRKRGSG